METICIQIYVRLSVCSRAIKIEREPGSNIKPPAAILPPLWNSCLGTSQSPLSFLLVPGRFQRQGCAPTVPVSSPPGSRLASSPPSLAATIPPPLGACPRPPKLTAGWGEKSLSHLSWLHLEIALEPFTLLRGEACLR